jgi:methionyl-tRNA formyltransferase
MGTAGFAVPSLRALAWTPHDVVAVYTQPPRPAGRGLKTRPSPVHRAALDLGLAVHTPATLKDTRERDVLAHIGPDLLVVAAYGLILPRAILAVPRLGGINLHASLLPRWRGAAPIQRALLAGDLETGVTIFQMEAALDRGPILAMERLAIAPDATAGTLQGDLAALAARMVGPVVNDLAAGRAAPRPQPDQGVTYAAKIDKAEGRLDWSQPAALLARRLRALNPRPGCWTEIDGQRLLVLEGEVVAGAGAPGELLDDRLTIACGEAALRLTMVQRAGGKPMSAADFLRGFPLPPGARLGSPCPATSWGSTPRARSRISTSSVRRPRRPCATRSTTICGRARWWCSKRRLPPTAFMPDSRPGRGSTRIAS